MKFQHFTDKSKLFLISLFMLSALIGCAKNKSSLPDGFTYLSEVDPTIIENVRYSTSENFLGRPVPGYSTNRIVCTIPAALALKQVHDELKSMGYNLVVYDAYRPQRSVDAFVKWADDMNDLTAKNTYYPTIDKKDLFKLDYIADKSGHSRGSTFDLTIIKSGEKLKPIKQSQRQLGSGESVPFLDDNTIDMGSSFDLFHPVSNHDSPLVGEEHTKLRNMLRETMVKHGFKPYQQEWWHYTLANEPYPETYFDFII